MFEIISVIGAREIKKEKFKQREWERERRIKKRTHKHADKESKVILLEPLSPKYGHRLLKKKGKGLNFSKDD